jgi:hypothetical protein
MDRRQRWIVAGVARDRKLPRQSWIHGDIGDHISPRSSRAVGIDRQPRCRLSPSPSWAIGRAPLSGPVKQLAESMDAMLSKMLDRRIGEAL